MRKTKLLAAGNGGDTASAEAKKFSTFNGVFTPTIMTIIGVVIFLRANFVVGHAGIYQALMILCLAKMITTLTGLSISAIATNTELKGGGTYYLISRSIGPAFGGAIGVTNFLAQALSIPFYLIGFSEALVITFDTFFNIDLRLYYDLIAYAVFAFMAFFSFKGAAIVLKVQFVVMIIMALSLASFLTGAALKFDPQIFMENLQPYDGAGVFPFWVLFAIYFPSVTGILSGVNMSGDLKNPTRSIPRGMLAAIGASFLVYAAQMVLVGGAVDRAGLIDKPYDSLIRMLPPFTTVLVVVGVLATTLANAFGTILGAPRVLQALAQDKLLKPLNPFAKITPRGEPRRALILTLVIGLAVIYFACGGGSGGGDALNMVAAVVAMLFLLTYGIINLAAFIESFGRNPSFRPRFKFFHWFGALAGAAASFTVTLFINVAAALLAAVIFAAMYFYVRKYVMTASFGDARRGFIYSRTRDNLLTLTSLPIHAKNWRPTVAAFVGDPEHREHLIKYADWLSSGRGILTIAAMHPGNFAENAGMREELLKKIDEALAKNRVKAFSEVLITPDFNAGVNHFLQSHSIGPIKPNMAIFGWANNPARALPYMNAVKTAASLNMNIGLIYGKDLPDLNPKAKERRNRRIDIWWRGERNGSLMVILAYLISLNSEWSGVRIRILRVVKTAEEKITAHAELERLIEAARMDVDVEAIMSSDDIPFPALLRLHSGPSTVVFLGLGITAETDPVEFQKGYAALLEGMPTTIMIQSTGEADLLS